MPTLEKLEAPRRGDPIMKAEGLKATAVASSDAIDTRRIWCGGMAGFFVTGYLGYPGILNNTS